MFFIFLGFRSLLSCLFQLLFQLPSQRLSQRLAQRFSQHLASASLSLIFLSRATCCTLLPWFETRAEAKRDECLGLTRGLKGKAAASDRLVDQRNFTIARCARLFLGVVPICFWQQGEGDQRNAAYRERTTEEGER